ncbi:MAG TPA: Gfo/Idh/MocA family oxidoreductase [Planctomycetota bacterium]|nr:Gfo/Idh/MocA family oxidoreductase [Planctomycetota bacterium]HRR80667.1 Gfo/Idh/MocA family oxidoreductase [Planctomycetota bacterium]HRT93255.1 Gfo/Idh/MocA family oxidoreductase [Planctomycetota bacterium]
MGGQVSRREFVRRAALGAGALLLANSRSARTYAANGKLNIALIGVGGRGKWYVDVVPKMENVVALCDVNESKAEAACKLFPDLPKFHDFRVMLDKMGKEMDAVFVATPDFTHAAAAVAAMQAGKHVLCEKPLTRTVYEARVMRDIAQKHKVASQMGNQGSASNSFRRGVELVEEGALGEVTEWYGFNADGGPNIKEPPKEAAPCPEYLKWDLWLGPAQYREFHPRWLGWTVWRDFSNYQLGNWGSHVCFLGWNALKLGSVWAMPPESRPRIRVQAEVSEINKLSFPRWQVIRWKVPAREGFPPLTFTWVNGQGGAAQQAWDKIVDYRGKKFKAWACGGLIVGTKGRMENNAGECWFVPVPGEQEKGEVISGPKKLPPSRGHEGDFFQACRGGIPAWGNFGNTGPYWEFMALGSIATQFPDELEYDPLECKIVNNAEADALLNPPRREGWELPTR